jgi:metal-responsive CopG/Arc/MetJ family transcriptional regulator
MSKNPRLFVQPVRLIVNVEQETVERIDDLMEGLQHHRHRNRAEFVRQAIERELARCQQ